MEGAKSILYTSQWLPACSCANDTQQAYTWPGVQHARAIPPIPPPASQVNQQHILLQHLCLLSYAQRCCCSNISCCSSSSSCRVIDGGQDLWCSYPAQSSKSESQAAGRSWSGVLLQLVIPGSHGDTHDAGHSGVYSSSNLITQDRLQMSNTQLVLDMCWSHHAATVRNCCGCSAW